MEMIDYIVITLILAIVGGALAYIIKEKKSGKKCIGCPYSEACSKNKNSGCSCGSDNKNK